MRLSYSPLPSGGEGLGVRGRWFRIATPLPPAPLPRRGEGSGFIWAGNN